MVDREKVIKELEHILNEARGDYLDFADITVDFGEEILALLKEQEAIKQKMWNALYAEEDECEKKYSQTDKHNEWFMVYRPWLQRGFEIAIKVNAEQE